MESILPPKPVSQDTYYTLKSLKYDNAKHVTYSKYVNYIFALFAMENNSFNFISTYSFDIISSFISFFENRILLKFFL